MNNFRGKFTTTFQKSKIMSLALFETFQNINFNETKYL